jgi:mannitol/fructose-specific phosphotransferase system IIA component (Ntr-type)
MLSPKSISGPHIAAIAEIAKFVKSKEIRKKLKNASSVEEIINIISQYENKEQSS